MDGQSHPPSMRYERDRQEGGGEGTLRHVRTRQRLGEEEEVATVVGDRFSSSSSLHSHDRISRRNVSSSYPSTMYVSSSPSQREYPPDNETRGGGGGGEEERRRRTGDGRGKAKEKEEGGAAVLEPSESTLHPRRRQVNRRGGGGGEEEEDEEARRRRRTTEERRRTREGERIRDDNEVDALYTSIDYVGQTIETSKLRYTWLLSIRGRQYQIDFLHSKVSGKKRLAVNSHPIYEQQVMRPHRFLYSWPVSEHLLSIVYESMDGHFHLTIDGLPFNYFTHRNKVLRNPQLAKQEQR
ncbi:hypothetical protein CSUI_008483, partial [Cystoisospora suis]